MGSWMTTVSLPQSICPSPAQRSPLISRVSSQSIEIQRSLLGPTWIAVVQTTVFLMMPGNVMLRKRESRLAKDSVVNISQLVTHRYFVSRALVRGTTAGGKRGWRVPAPELERVVLTAALSIMANQAALVVGIQDSSEAAENVEQIRRVSGGLSKNRPGWRSGLDLNPRDPSISLPVIMVSIVQPLKTRLVSEQTSN
jgi:hypothetical protein